MNNKKPGRPLTGKAKKSVKISVRITKEEESFLVKHFGAVSTAIDYLIKKEMKNEEGF